MKTLYFILTLIFPIITFAQTTITSVASGNWSNTSTWDCNCVPTGGSNVIILAGNNISLDLSTVLINNLTINGILNLGTNELSVSRNLIASALSIESTSGGFIFSSDTIQVISFVNTQTNTINKITKNGTGELRLQNDLFIQSLQLNGGFINSKLNNVTLFILGTVNRTGGSIVGRVARYVSVGPNYLFPVGTSTNYNPANLTFTSLSGGTNYVIVCEFVNSSPGSVGIPISTATGLIGNVFTDGFWKIKDQTGTATINYNITLNASGFTSLPFTSKVRLLSRKGITPWENVPIISNDTINKIVVANGLSDISKDFSLGIICNNTSTLQGIITYSGGSFGANDANVKLFNVNTHDLISEANTNNSSSGNFLFSNLAIGNYFVKADILNSATYPSLHSSYYDSTYKWSDANIVQMMCGATKNIIIKMVEFTPPAIGNCNISGILTYHAVNKSANGEPIPGAEITLEQEPDDEPIMVTTSGNDGTYDFLDIPAGLYSLNIEIPGLPQFSTHTLSLTATDTVFSGVNFYVDTNGVNQGIYSDSIIYSPIINNETILLKIYPNPFTDKITVSFDIINKSSFALSISDLKGNEIASTGKVLYQSGHYDIIINKDFENISSGFYLLRVSDDKAMNCFKILKQ
ncbi:MAG: hypothetical protein A2033_17785 [Bacteroidetes bacterium GWA2_31_9]|nr:MAG: hypothetical protein A2033_17785 [Bacteroidetes bacterium GWA2_31_9]